jgi:MFS family permease
MAIPYEPPVESSVGRPSPLLLTRDFSWVWWGQIVSQVGDGISKLALLWFVYAITGSPLKTTMIGLLQTVPPIVFGPMIGVLVDRLPKKVLLIGSDVMRAVLLGLIPCLISPESFTVGVLYVLVFLHAIASAVFGPALTATIPFLVPRPQFTAANALLQSTTSLGIILGPALSGVGIALLSSQEVLCVNAVTYLASAACFIPISLSAGTSSRRTIANPLAGTIRDLIAGVRFAFVREQTILLLMLTASLYTFGTSALSTLFPVFGRKLLDLGPVEVGYLWSAMGVGLLVTSLVLIRLTQWNLRKRISLIMAASATSGIAICALVFARSGIQAGLLMGVIGLGMGALTPIAWGVLQELTPKDMVGRVLALYNTGAMTAAIGGILTFGWITERLGEPTGVIGIGLVLLATAVMAGGFGHWVAGRSHS